MRLLESQPEKKGRSVGGTLFSIILHVSIIFLAVYATASAGARKAEKPKEEKVSFVEMKKEEPPPPKKVEEPKPEPPKPKKAAPAPPKVNVPRVATPAPPQGFKVVAPVINIPTKLPTIDLSKAITNAADFTGKGVAGGSASGVKGGTGKEGDTGKEAGVKQGPYFEFQVEKPVVKIGGDNPDYPPSLRDNGVEGQVLAQFVVGENGRYEGGTLKILNSSNPGFTAAVKDALPRMRFSAAQIGGKKVAQLVQMPFQFNIKR